MCAVLPHGEHGAIVRLLTPAHGLLAGYVRGGRSRRLRPVLQIGNRVAATLRSRVEEQLPAVTAELSCSRALLALDPLAAAGLEWVGGFLSAALPPAQSYTHLWSALDHLLDRMSDDPESWTADLARFELLALAELGFGLDFSACAATGEAAATADLTHVSPKSGGAVSRIAATPYAARLLRLPPFLLNRAPADPPAILDALRLTGHFLDRDLLEGSARRPLVARERLVSLIQRRIAA